MLERRLLVKTPSGCRAGSVHTPKGAIPANPHQLPLETALSLGSKLPVRKNQPVTNNA